MVPQHMRCNLRNLVSVVPHSKVRAWAGKASEMEGVSQFDVVDIRTALETRHTTDAHAQVGIIWTEGKGFCDAQPRLRTTTLGAVRELGSEVVYTALLEDVDAPKKGMPEEEVQEWFDTQLKALAKTVIGSTAGWYRTRNGGRLVWLLHACDTETYLQIRAQVAKCLNTVGVIRDEQTKDWTRLFRLPRVVRDGNNVDLPMDLSCLDYLPVEGLPHVPPVDATGRKRARNKVKALDKAVAACRIPLKVRREEAANWLAAFPPAIQGELGSNKMLRAATTLVRGFLLPEEEAADLLEEEYSPKCEPSWTRKEINHKVRDAYLVGEAVPGEELDPLLRGTVSMEPARKVNMYALLSPGNNGTLLHMSEGVKDSPEPDHKVPGGFYCTDHKGVGGWKAGTAKDDVPTSPVIQKEFWTGPLQIVAELKGTKDPAYVVATKLDGVWEYAALGKEAILGKNAASEINSKTQLFAPSFASTAMVAYVTGYLSSNRLRECTAASHVGWQKDKACFVLPKTIIDDKGERTLGLEDYKEGYVIDPGLSLTAQGIARKGTYEEWEKATRLLDPYPRAQLAIMATLAAPLLELVNEGTFIMDWSDPTGSGKTSMLEFAAATWGNRESVYGWEATRTFLERRLVTSPHLPFLIDDTANADQSDLEKTIYTLAGGKTKGRSNKELTTADVEHWRTIVLSTGEQPITSFGNKGGGRARVVPIEGAPFPGMPESTFNQASRLFEHNGGHAGPMFVSYLAGKDKYELRSRLRNIRTRLDEASNTTNMVVRRNNRYRAILVLAHELAKDAGVISFDDPTQRAWAQEEVIADAAGAQRSFELVQGWVSANLGKFAGFTAAGFEPHAGWYGILSEESIYIFRHMLDPFLARFKYLPDEVYGAWRKADILQAPNHQFTVSAAYPEKMSASGLIAHGVLSFPRETMMPRDA